MTSPLELTGDWALRRRAHDRRHGRWYAMTGTLTLQRDADEVRWLECGELRWGGGRADVTREYRIVRSPDGWDVLFADGRPFHPWVPGRLVHHPCGEDVYRGLIDTSCSRLRVWWDVTGPAKDQRIVTRCVRAG